MRTSFVGSIVALVVFVGACGKQQNATPSGVSEESRFSTVSEQVFQPSCTRCHSGEEAAAAIDFSNYAAVMASGAVEPGDAAASRLIQAVKSNGADRMPLNGARLSQGQIALLEAWINGGAKE